MVAFFGGLARSYTFLSPLEKVKKENIMRIRFNRALFTLCCLASSATLFAQTTTPEISVDDFGIDPSSFASEIVSIAGPWFVAAIGIGVAFWAVPLLWRKFKGVAK